MKALGRRALLQYSLASAICAWAGLGSSARAMAQGSKQELPLEPRSLRSGSGAFLTSGGPGREQKRIGVHYHKPSRFCPASPVLIVIPGAGRNGDSYRDAWIETAEKNCVLVAALSYPEADYDFAAYQLGGVVENLVIHNLPTDADGQSLSVAHLRDEDIEFTLNPRREEWLFNDFDRIFALLAAMTGSSQSGYDMFGHSAGGQILHRLALFHPGSRAKRIVAANAGFYTLPDLDLPQPVGLKGAGLTDTSLARSFAEGLIVMLGEDDSGDDAGGLQVHTPLIDRQGLHRLARGRYFHAASHAKAREIGASFNWTLRTVPKVGHDYRAISRVAGGLLYG